MSLIWTGCYTFKIKIYWVGSNACDVTFARYFAGPWVSIWPRPCLQQQFILLTRSRHSILGRVIWVVNQVQQSKKWSENGQKMAIKSKIRQGFLDLHYGSNHVVVSASQWKRAYSANFKMVWYVFLRPLRPELDGQDQVQIIVTRALSCSH
jgi:hypothetical protein